MEPRWPPEGNLKVEGKGQRSRRPQPPPQQRRRQEKTEVESKRKSKEHEKTTKKERQSTTNIPASLTVSDRRAPLGESGSYKGTGERPGSKQRDPETTKIYTKTEDQRRSTAVNGTPDRGPESEPLQLQNSTKTVDAIGLTNPN